MNVLHTQGGVYRAAKAGTYRDDPDYQVKAGDSWLKPANTQKNTPDRYTEYTIEPER